MRPREASLLEAAPVKVAGRVVVAEAVTCATVEARAVVDTGAADEVAIGFWICPSEI